ncbi:MAG: CocE/NonD family hydrolase [Ferruginibacter sp.]
MKKSLLLLFIITISLKLSAQKFYFPPAYYTDSIALEKNIPVLASQVIMAYKEENKLSYYDNLSRYQIVAKQYQQAIQTINLYRAVLNESGGSDTLTAKGIAFQFETYASAKILQQDKSSSFIEIYKNNFDNYYLDLSQSAKDITPNMLTYNVSQGKYLFYGLLRKLANSDSISLNDARALCRSYNSYNIYRQIFPFLQTYFAAQDQKEFIIQDSVLITMRDGVKLAAVIVRSRKATIPQPVVMMSNIYYSPYEVAKGKFVVHKGFAFVMLNTRGKYLSDAAIEPFEHDANDAYDAIDWISRQSWCNGKIGMYGGSYLGFTQWAAVKNLHPALKTIVPQVAVAAGIDYPMHNGVFMSYMLRWIHYVANNKLTDRADESEFNDTKKWNATFIKWYTAGNSFRSLDTVEGRPNFIFQRWLQHPAYDSYWKSMTPQKEEFAKINIPVLTITGYFDDDQRGAFYYFNRHHLYNKNADHYLVIGPWNHGGAQSHGYSTAGYTLDAAGNISIDDIVFQWFNYILKDSSKPAILKDKINYEVMGTNQWKHVPTLAKLNNDTLIFYLSNTAVENKYYQLQTKQPAVKYSIDQNINFMDRSDSMDMNDVRNSDDYPILDSTIDTRNYLKFISAPLAKPIEITGSFAGEIITSINKKDVDINVQLYELQPDGKYFQLSSYITRASYTKDKSKRQLLQPFKEENIPINNSFFVSKKLSAGSRIIVLAGINKNRDWEVNYGTGKNVSDENINDGKVPLEIKWFNNSVIKIPVWKY